MLKGRNRLLGAAGAAVAAGAIAVSGVAAAGAASHRSAAGTESFQIMSTSATSKTVSIIARGVFTAGGVVHQGGSTGSAVFPNGSIKITHSKGTGPSSSNPKTCLFTLSKSGTYTLSGGTGAYAGISGSGTYKLSILAVGAKSGGVCSKTLPPPTFQQIIKATGTATLP